jgi:hypothetical protein
VPAHPARIGRYVLEDREALVPDAHRALADLTGPRWEKALETGLSAVIM